MKCHTCNKPMRASKDLSFNGHRLSGFICSCGESYYDLVESQRILLANKLRKEELKAKLGRIRSNLILRLPRDIEMVLGLREGDEVSLKVKGKELVVGRG